MTHVFGYKIVKEHCEALCESTVCGTAVRRCGYGEWCKCDVTSEPMEFVDGGETGGDVVALLGPLAESEAHLGFPDVSSLTTVNWWSESIEALPLETIEEPSVHACMSDSVCNTEEVSVPSDAVLASAEVKSVVSSLYD